MLNTFRCLDEDKMTIKCHLFGRRKSRKGEFYHQILFDFYLLKKDGKSCESHQTKVRLERKSSKRKIEHVTVDNNGVQ